jgi:hypothetical protein
VGSDLSWETRWLSNEDVVIDLFDFGSGVSHYENKNALRRNIRQIHLHLNRETGELSELASAT